MELSFILLYNNFEKIINENGKMEWGGEELSPVKKDDCWFGGWSSAVQRSSSGNVYTQLHCSYIPVPRRR